MDAISNIAARYASDLYRSRNWHDQREYEARFVRAINEGIVAATASMERELTELRSAAAAIRARGGAKHEGEERC